VSRTYLPLALLRAGGGLLPLLLLAPGPDLAARADPRPASTATREERDPAAMLAQGDRLFREGDFRSAMRAYESAAAGGPADPLLAYDLGVAAHRLGRLPVAVLWYRRAARPLVPDPWLAENLAAARQSLGAAPPRPRGIAFWAAHRDELHVAGILLAWAALALYALPSRRRKGASAKRGRMIAALALLSLASFGAGEWLARRGPRAAVLLAPCGALPAGSEVWVEPAPSRGDDLRVSSGGPACPAAAIGLVDPP
jgi:tetratricopeptide (TPR) repeat protein